MKAEPGAVSHEATCALVHRIRALPRSLQEKMRQRDEALKEKLENERMSRLYREHILGEKKVEGFVPLDGLLGSAPSKPAPQVEKQEEVGAMGD